jgi:hypothetical protein
METIKHPYLRYKTEKERYTLSEIEKTSICLKHNDNRAAFSDCLHEMYKEKLFFIGLVRNGYAVAEGWLRRWVKSAEEAGKFYNSCIETLLRQREQYENFKIIKFEDMIKDPFKTVHQLFEYLALEPTNLKKLMIRADRTRGRRIHWNWNLASNIGEKLLKSKRLKNYLNMRSFNQFCWYGPDEINSVLDTDVNLKQISKLSTQQKKDFEKNAKLSLERFGYLGQYC